MNPRGSSVELIAAVGAFTLSSNDVGHDQDFVVAPIPAPARHQASFDRSEFLSAHKIAACAD
jgi:hypothetical protein